MPQRGLPFIYQDYFEEPVFTMQKLDLDALGFEVNNTVKTDMDEVVDEGENPNNIVD